MRLRVNYYIGTIALRLLSSRIFIFASSLLLSVLTTELFLQIFDEYQDGPHQIFCEYHPLLGWQKIPNFKGLHVGPQDVYRIYESINSKGLRGPEYTYQKNNNEIRLVALGDSFTEGYTVDFSEVFSQVLKDKLNEISSSQPVEVINAGTGGYSTDQELLWFQTEGKQYNPDITLLMFTNNDILFNNETHYWRGFKPKYEIKGESLVLTNTPVPKLEQKSSTKSISLFERSILISRFKTLLVKYHFITPQSDKAVRIKEKPLSLPDYKRLSEWSGATEQEKTEALVVTAALLKELKKEAKSISSRLIVFIIPEKKEPTLPSIIMRICQEHQIECIDPTRVFEMREKEFAKIGEKIDFNPYDFHWNKNGHQIAAEVLFNYIKENNILATPPDSKNDTVPLAKSR